MQEERKAGRMEICESVSLILISMILGEARSI